MTLLLMLCMNILYLLLAFILVKRQPATSDFTDYLYYAKIETCDYTVVFITYSN